jgi:hypothetical protein
MKNWLLLLILAVMGCSSGMTAIDAIEGGPGQDISVAVGGVEESMMPIDREGSRTYNLQIEVSNNSNTPVTVTRITVGPATGMPRAFAISRSSATFNEMIDPGEDHLFDVRLEGRLVRPFQDDESRSVEFRVIVSLANGESYFYTFEGPVMVSP